MNDTVVLWRDGRDIIVSQYFYYLFKNEYYNHNLTDKTREILNFEDYNDVKANLPKFIEYIFRENQMNYTDFDLKGVIYVHYEDLLKNPVENFSELIYKLSNKRLSPDFVKSVIDNNSIEKYRERAANNSITYSFYRKGVAGEYKKYFNQEAEELYDRYFGDALRILNYKKN